MGASLRAGLAALADGPHDAVRRRARRPAAARRRRPCAGCSPPGGPAAVATYGGGPRNPVRLDRDLWADVAARASGDEGARSWLRAHPDLVAAVACDDTGSPLDVDTPDDLAPLAADAVPVPSRPRGERVKLENSFTVPVPRAEAWKVLMDVERVAPCMPGATLTSRDGDSFTGTVKVKVGPINLTYGGYRDVRLARRGRRRRGDRGQRQGDPRHRHRQGAHHLPPPRERRQHRGRRRHRPRRHRQARAVRPRRAGRRQRQAGRPVRREPGGGDRERGTAPADAPAADLAPRHRPVCRWASAPGPPCRWVEGAGSAPSPRAGSPAAGSAPSAPGHAVRPVREAEAIDLLDTAGLPVLKRAAPVAGALAALLLVYLLGWRRGASAVQSAVRSS